MTTVVHFTSPNAAKMLANPDLYLLPDEYARGTYSPFGPLPTLSFVRRSERCLEPLDDFGVCLRSLPHGGRHTDEVTGCDACDRYTDSEIVMHRTIYDTDGVPDVTYCQFCSEEIPEEDRVEAEDAVQLEADTFDFGEFVGMYLAPTLGHARTNTLVLR